MNGEARRILLQHQHTRTSDSIGIVLDQECRADAGDNVIKQNIIGSQFAEAVQGWVKLIDTDKLLNPDEGFAHSLPPIAISYSAATVRFRRPASRRSSAGFKNAPV